MLFDADQNVGVWHLGAAYSSILRGAHQEHFFKLELVSGFILRQLLEHNPIICSYFVLVTLNSHYSEELLLDLWVNYVRDFWVVHDDFAGFIGFFSDDGIIKFSFLALLLQSEGLLPPVRDLLPLFVVLGVVDPFVDCLRILLAEELGERGSNRSLADPKSQVNLRP